MSKCFGCSVVQLLLSNAQLLQESNKTKYRHSLPLAYNRVFPKRMRRTIESSIHIHVRSLSNQMVALTSLPVSRQVSHFDQKMIRILENKKAQRLDTAGHSGWGKCHGNVIYQNSIKGRTLLRCPSVKTENGVDKSL